MGGGEEARWMWRGWDMISYHNALDGERYSPSHRCTSHLNAPSHDCSSPMLEKHLCVHHPSQVSRPRHDRDPSLARNGGTRDLRQDVIGSIPAPPGRTQSRS